MKIAIELNKIVRDINNQAIKYFKKDIQKDFDDKNIDKNVSNIIDSLPFKSEKARNTFTYIDYPYEIFGCAKSMHRNLQVQLDEWVDKLNNLDKEHFDIVHFSLKENALTIQSTYYFLSKTGTRVREMYFPIDGLEIWDKADVVITTDERIVRNKPANKIVILIKKNDNTELIEKADFVYDSLLELMEDDNFYNNITSKQPIPTFWTKVGNNIKQIFTKNED